MDSDQNFAFTQKSEVIAFNDSLIIPRMEERLRMDTALPGATPRIEKRPRLSVRATRSKGSLVKAESFRF